MIHRSYWIQRRTINSRVVHIFICSIIVSVFVFATIMVFAVTGQSTSPNGNDQIDALVRPTNEPMDDLLKSIVKHFPPIKHHPKDLSTLFKDPLLIPSQVDNRLESLLEIPKPKLLKLNADSAVYNVATRQSPIESIKRGIEPQLHEDLPVRIMIQSSDVHNNYTVSNADDSFEVQENQTDAIINSPDNATDVPRTEIVPSTTTEIIPATQTVEDYPTIPLLSSLFQVTTSPPSTTTEKFKESGSTVKSKEVKEKDKPSMDKIAEAILQRYQYHDDIPSYEDVWYDENGDLMWSQEDNLGRNVKRQVASNNIVRPVPLAKSGEARAEVERLTKVTDVIERFRSMLDIAQQVDYYLTKRLQTGINAIAAMYNDNPQVGCPRN